MSGDFNAQKVRTSVSQNVPWGPKVDELPPTAILAPVLKTLESELQRKGLLEAPSQTDFHPVWFLVETERNVYLWRQGRSVIEQDDFEFWVDLDALISKRLEQLENVELENPFTNPQWGSESGASSLDRISSREIRYLHDFRRLLKTIVPHIHALSAAGSMASQQLGVGSRPRVVLPSKNGR